MMTYEAACESVGYTRGVIPPEKKIVYLAYKEGECKKFDTLSDAKSFSKLIEEKVVNEVEIDFFRKTQREKERLANELFLSEFRKRFYELSDNQFSCIWSEAWEDSHSYGYDEVASKFYDLYIFIQRFNRCDK